MVTWAVTLALGCLVAGNPSNQRAADLTKIERAIHKEPEYKSKSPRYCLLVFGPRADYQVWMVLDGETLYVDRNGNGDLTEAGESTEAERKTDPGSFRPLTFLAADAKTEESLQFAMFGWNDYAAGKDTDKVSPYVAVTWKGRRFGAWGDEIGPCVWSRGPQDAPILHIDGPLRMGFETRAKSALIGRGDGKFELNVGVGTKGLGKGAFVHLSYANGVIPQDAPEGPPIVVRTVLKHRCCGCRLRDTVRVEGVALKGTFKIRLEYDEWQEGRVAPADLVLNFPLKLNQ